MNENREQQFSRQVDDFVLGRLSDEQEQAFGEAMLESPALQEEVLATWALVQGLRDQQSVRSNTGWRAWAIAATVFGVAVGSAALFQYGQDVGDQTLVSARSYALAGGVRGGGESMMIDGGSGPLSLVVPMGRCSAVDQVELSGPGSGSMHQVPRFKGREFVLTLTDPAAGEYRLGIHYSEAGCASEYRNFTILPDAGADPVLPAASNVEKLFEGAWVIRKNSSSRMVAPGGKLEIYIENVDGQRHAVFFASGMGEATQAWNSVTNARLLDVAGGLIQGSIADEHGAEHPFTIVREGGSIRGSITSPALASSAKIDTQDEVDDGEWMGDPGAK